MLQIIFFATYLFFASLTNANKEAVPFNISNPQIKIELSKELKEISGLTWFNNNQLGTVQDEAGIFYLLNSNTGKIEEKIKFSLPGDFEGVESVGNCIYTLTSSGTLFYFDKNKPEDVKRINTPLNLMNDAEGLGYDAISNQLLIICKESGGIKNSKFKGKSIYGLNIENHAFSDDPFATIKKSSIEEFVKVDKFKPSAIAVDPLTQDIYIIASAGKLLVVLGKDLKVKAAVKLPSKKYAQPEGICFSPEGDLFISNEGKDHKATIYHIKRNK